MSRSIIDYFSQNYSDLLALAIQVCARVSAKPEAGQDVLHQVALVLCQKQAELSDVKDYGAYIATCIRRAAINYARKEARSIPVDLDRLDREPDARQAGDAYDYWEWVASLEKHLERFAPAMRRAFVAHYVDDVPSTQLARELGISEKALSLRFARMRRELQRSATSMIKHLNVLLLLG